MKVTKDELKRMVKKIIKSKLNEKFDYSNDLVPDSIADYSSKVDKFMQKTIEEARKLHDEAEEMMRANILSSYEVQERNRYLLYHVGFLNNLVSNLIHRLEDKSRQ